MKFLSKILGQGIGQHLSLKKSGPEFESITGYFDIKNIIYRALESEDSINILFWGEPASSKTMFLMELAKQKGAVYFDCTNTTNKILQSSSKQVQKTLPSTIFGATIEVDVYLNTTWSLHQLLLRQSLSI